LHWLQNHLPPDARVSWQENIRRCAHDLKNGALDVAKTAGGPIIFCTEGFLRDGNTRVHACVAAQVPFNSHIVRGVVWNPKAGTEPLRRQLEAAVLE
jgi:hypothetical protein